MYTSAIIIFNMYVKEFIYRINYWKKIFLGVALNPEPPLQTSSALSHCPLPLPALFRKFLQQKSDRRGGFLVGQF
jgi:hypothetical protein